MADDAAVLLGHPGEEAGDVLEGEERDVERVAEAHEARALDRGVDVEDPGEDGRLVGDDAHRVSADVREAGRRLLIETAARKEIAMMAPVVFFVLPVTILFAFYPGVLGLRLTTP